MTSELFSIFAMTSNGVLPAGWAGGDPRVPDYLTQLTAATSGAMLLASPIFTMMSGYPTANYIRIPKGCAFKVWESKIKSDIVPATVHIRAMNTSGTGTYTTVETDTADVADKEQRTIRSGRPLVIESHDGETFVQFLFQTPGSTVTLASYNCEIVELNVD